MAQFDSDGDYIIEWGRNRGKVPNKTFSEIGTKAANYLSPHKLKLDQRRNKILELRTKRGWYIDDIVDYINANADKYLVEDGTYSSSQFRTDMLAVLRTIREDTREMAKEWLPRELTRLEEEEDQITVIMDKLYDRARREDPTLKNIEDYEKLARTYTNLQKRADSIRNRRAKYLPLETPKQVDIRSQNVYGTVEDYLELRRSQEEQEEEAIEGEFSETS